ncbi:MAG: hypothetical protein EU533_07415 [Promethearchaeota archaeon]|nr:MAG: hypothetical protein EU533_07415 [Candidatus Lokiarchaeota archaeon]
MKRLNSIDTFRGISILWMFLGHLLDWWLIDQDSWVYNLTFNIVDPIGSSAFIFIAGVSTAISLRIRYIRADVSEKYDARMIKREYLYRALLIFVVALLYNVSIAITLLNPLYIWTWFVLLTIAISLLLAWPLFKLPILYRIIIGVFIWIGNQYLLILILPYQGAADLFGFLFHIFYHSLDLDVILAFFPFFLFGSVIGELIFKIYQTGDTEAMKKALKKKLVYPLSFIGILLILLGIFIRFPEFFVKNRSFSWMIYTLGIDISLLMVFTIFEEFIHLKKRMKRSILFYFSYYSLTIYLTHNLLFFVFYKQISMFFIWIFILGVYLVAGYLLKLLYKKLGYKLSLKYQIGRMAKNLAKGT